MAKLSQQEVEKIAQLARLGIEKKDREYYAEELSEVLGYVETLGAVETGAVELTSHVSGLHNVYREDSVASHDEEKRSTLVVALLSLIPFKEGRFAKVRAVFKK